MTGPGHLQSCGSSSRCRFGSKPHGVGGRRAARFRSAQQTAWEGLSQGWSFHVASSLAVTSCTCGTTPVLFSTGFPALLCSQTRVQYVSDQSPLFDPSSGGSGICLVSACISVTLSRNAAEVKLYAFFFLLPLLPWWLWSPVKSLCSSS